MSFFIFYILHFFKQTIQNNSKQFITIQNNSKQFKTIHSNIHAGTSGKIGLSPDSSSASSASESVL